MRAVGHSGIWIGHLIDVHVEGEEVENSFVDKLDISRFFWGKQIAKQRSSARVIWIGRMSTKGSTETVG